MMHLSSRFTKISPPVILSVTLFGVYLATMAPGLTWANYGADGGDLISAAATGGVAHPTGYPTYLLLARLFQFFPFGSLAFRTNLLSGITTVLSAVLVYLLTIRFLSQEDPPKQWMAGLAAGFAFGLAPLVWSQAVITEVYALNALFVVWLLFLSETCLSRHLTQRLKDCLLGLSFGLALGNHITIGFLFPILFSGLLRRIPSWPPQEKKGIGKLRVDWQSSLWRIFWVGMGLLVYLTLPMRAFSRPPINWGNPVTLGNFEWLVTGRIYQGQLFANPLPVILERIRSVASIFLGHFGLIGLTIGLVGLIVYFSPVRFYYQLIWISGVFVVFPIIYSTSDSLIYLIPALICFSIWLGIGTGRLMDRFTRQGRSLPILAGGVVLSILFIQAGIHYRQVDASKDTRAASFADAVLARAPADAIVFTKGDQAVFSMWYYHFALHSRPDLVVIASDLLQFDWYLQTLRSTYPAMDLSEPFPFPETVIVLNPNRSACYVQADQQPEISCEPPRGLARP